jgi:hypothetical protein
MEDMATYLEQIDLSTNPTIGQFTQFYSAILNHESTALVV